MVNATLPGCYIPFSTSFSCRRSLQEFNGLRKQPWFKAVVPHSFGTTFPMTAAVIMWLRCEVFSSKRNRNFSLSPSHDPEFVRLCGLSPNVVVATRRVDEFEHLRNAPGIRRAPPARLTSPDRDHVEGRSGFRQIFP